MTTLSTSTIRWCRHVPVNAHRILSEAEHSHWRQMTACAKIKHRWIRGRIAAKQAVLDSLPAVRRSRYTSSCISILPDASGCPRVHADGLSRRVSISHTDSCSVAIAAIYRDLQGIGIDAEDTGTCHDGLAEGGFSEEELAHIGTRDPSRLLPFWCAKEAAAKSTGRGFGGDPLNTRILRAEDGGPSVRVRVGRDAPVNVSMYSHANTVYAAAFRRVA